MASANKRLLYGVNKSVTQRLFCSNRLWSLEWNELLFLIIFLMMKASSCVESEHWLRLIRAALTPSGTLRRSYLEICDDPADAQWTERGCELLSGTLSGDLSSEKIAPTPRPTLFPLIIIVEPLLNVTAVWQYFNNVNLIQKYLKSL